MKAFTWSLGAVALVVGIVVGLPVLVFVAFGVSEAFSALGSPSAVTPERAAMVGTWTNPDGARLVLRANGTCVVSGVPKQTEDGTWEAWNGLPFNGTGTWAVEPLGADAGNSGGIDVSVGKFDAFLSTTSDPKHPDLFVTVGDPDNADYFDFTKQPG